MTLLAERHEVIGVVCHLHAFKTSEAREAYAVMNIYRKFLNTFLGAHLAERVSGKISIGQAPPPGRMVYLLTVLTVEIIFFAGYSTVFSCVSL